MKKKIAAVCKTIGIISLFLLAGAYFAGSATIVKKQEDQTLCKTIDVRIVDSASIQLVVPQDVYTLLENKKIYLIGEKLYKIDLFQLEQLINQEKGIKKCEIYTQPDGTLTIRIFQRTPLLRLETSQGSYYVDETGALFPTIPKRTVHVPVVSGKIPIKDSVWIAQLFDFGNYIRNHRFWNARIEQLYVHNPHNIEIIQQIDNQEIVMIGDLSRFEYKLQKLYTFYHTVATIEGGNKYAFIDLRFSNQIVCRRTPPS